MLPKSKQNQGKGEASCAGFSSKPWERRLPGGFELLLLLVLTSTSCCFGISKVSADNLKAAPSNSNKIQMLGDCQNDIIVIINRTPNRTNPSQDAKPPNEIVEKCNAIRSALCSQHWKTVHGTYVYTFFKDGSCRGYDTSSNKHAANHGDWEIVYDKDGTRGLGPGKFGLGLSRGCAIYNLTIDKNNQIQIENFAPVKISDPSLDTTANTTEFPSVAARSRALTSTKWKLANNLNDHQFPKTIEFRPDMSLVSENSKGESKAGVWSIDDFEIASNIASLSPLPADTAKFNLVNKSTLICGPHRQLYVPEGTVLKRPEFVAWTPCEMVKLRVIYDSPIKAGVVNNFDVEVSSAPKKYTRWDASPYFLRTFGVLQIGQTAKSLSDLNLSLNKKQRFIWEMKGNPNLKLIARMDLKNEVLRAGESYKFRLPVTFKESGYVEFGLETIVNCASSTHAIDYSYAELPHFIVKVEK